MYACLQYFWTYVISFYFKKTGTLAKITSPLGFIPAFISNLIVAIPMIVVFVGTVIRYKRDFDDKMMYIKTDRYLLTLILTVIYSLMLPLATRLDATPKRGAFAWIYYLVFISFLEEFLYRSLVPTLMDRSSFPSWVKALIPAIIGFLINCTVDRKKIKISRFIVIVAICQLIAHLTFVLANKLTSVGNAIILQYSSMVFVLIYECIDLKKRPKPYQLLVVLMAFTGMFIFFVDSLSIGNMLGNTLALVSGMFFGLQFYLNTKTKYL